MQYSQFIYFMEVRGTTGRWYSVRWTWSIDTAYQYVEDEVWAWRKYLEMKRQFEPMAVHLCRVDRNTEAREVMG